MFQGILKQSTARNTPILMLDSTDHITGKTGLTLTITGSKDGAAFASITPTVTELATGWYNLALTTTHTNTLGTLAVHITSTGADPADYQWQVCAELPGIVATNNDKTGYTASTVSDKTGYALTSGEHTSIATDTQTGLTAQGYTTTRAGYMDTLNGLVAAVWAAATRTLTAFAFSVTAGTVSDKTGYALTAGEHTSIASDTQSGMTTQGYTTARASYLDVLNGIIAAIWANATRTLSAFGFNVTVGTNNDKTGYSLSVTPPTAAQVSTQVWSEAIPGSYGTGTAGKKLDSASSAGDPWSTAVPGAYGAGTAGNILGNRLDAAISTRSAPSDVLTQVNTALDAAGTELTTIPTPANATLRQKIQAIYQYFFHKRTTTATTEILYKDNGSTSLATSTVSDDGTTATHGKIA